MTNIQRELIGPYIPISLSIPSSKEFSLFRILRYSDTELFLLYTDADRHQARGHIIPFKEVGSIIQYDFPEKSHVSFSIDEENQIQKIE